MKLLEAVQLMKTGKRMARESYVDRNRFNYIKRGSSTIEDSKYSDLSINVNILESEDWVEYKTEPETMQLSFVEYDKANNITRIYTKNNQFLGIHEGNKRLQVSSSYSIFNSDLKIDKEFLATFEKKKFEDLKVRDIWFDNSRRSNSKCTDINYMIGSNSGFLFNQYLVDKGSFSCLNSYSHDKNYYKNIDVWVLRK